MKKIIDSFKDLLRKRSHPIANTSFLDIHYHYDNNEFIQIWTALLNSNPALWQESLEKSTGGKKILIATLGGGFSHRPFLAMDTILRIALTLRGAKVENYFCDHALPACFKAEYAYIKPVLIQNEEISKTLCKGCYKDVNSVSANLGLTTHNMSNFITQVERTYAKETARNMDFSDIKNYKINNVCIGKHALAGAMRYFAHSDPTQSPFGVEISRRYLEAAITSYYATKKLLEENDYESVCLTHGSYIPHGIVRETCENLGVPVTCWSLSYLKQRFSFTYGEMARFPIAEPNDNWQNIKWEERHKKKIMNYLDSRWGGGKDWLKITKKNQSVPFLEYAKEQNLDLNKPIIGLLTNLIWESYAEYTSNVFPDMLTWIKRTITYFKERQDLQLLIRVHPAESQGNVSNQLAVDEIKKMFPKLPANVFIINSHENVNTYDAMQYCDSALIYQTQAGLELAMQGVPVIVSGNANIRNKGFAYEPESEKEYFRQLDELPFNTRLSEEKVISAQKYAYHAFYRSFIPLPFFEETKDWMVYKPTLKKLDELLPRVHEGLDIICNGILNGSAYIYPAEDYEEE